MRFQLVVALTILTLVGCATPQHIEWLQRPDRMVIAPGHSNLSVNVRTDTADRKQQPKIDVSRSYALRGEKRYGLRIVDNAYTDQFGGNQITKFIFLVDTDRASPSPDNSPQDVLLWKSGQWLLHLAFISDPPFEPIEARFRLRTGLYVFPFSGFPN